MSAGGGDRSLRTELALFFALTSEEAMEPCVVPRMVASIPPGWRDQNKFFHHPEVRRKGGVARPL